jgi:hypothetical protein
MIMNVSVQPIEVAFMRGVMEIINNIQVGRLMGTVMVTVLLLWGLHAVPARAQTQAQEAQQVSEQNVFGKKTYDMLSSREYGALEQRFLPYLDSYANNKITDEELAWRFAVFSMMTEVEPRLDEWVRAFPNSYTARLARGIYHVTDAWKKRGDLMGDRTTDDQMKGFHESLKKAQSDLVSSLPLYARPVDSYRYLIRVAKGLSLGNERDMLDKALKLDPKAFKARAEYYDAITPRWGGSEREMAVFLEDCNKSQMSDKDKKRIEGIYYYDLAQQARLEKNYKAGSDYFYKYYLTDRNPNVLLWSVQGALDGKLQELAMQRLNELNRVHPSYPFGFEMRAQLYEYHYKDIKKALQDYLAAADLGASWSQNHMGWYYMKGINVPVSYVKAKHYLDLAAKQGNETAEENLDILKKLQKGE